MIRLIEPNELQDPKLREVADRIADSVIFAGQKALLHLEEPAAFPLPVNPVSFERLLFDVVRELPATEVKSASRRVAQSVRISPIAVVSRANSAVFAQVDLHNAEEIELQLGRLSPEFTRGQLNVLRRIGGSTQRTMSGGLPGSGTSNLRWRLRRLDCNTETGLTAAGTDHVYIGGVAVDAFGNSTVVPVQDLGGDWDSGNHESWPDRTLTSFDLDHGTGWPRPCALILAISVRSSKGLWELIDKIVAKAKEEVIKYAAAAVGTAIGTYVGFAAGSLGGPLGAAAGAVVGAVVGYVVGYVIEKLWEWLKSLFTGTKLFKPIPLTVEVPFHGADFGGSLTSGSFQPWWKGHYGKYTATLDTVLTWGPASVPAAISRDTNKLDLFRVDSTKIIQGQSWGKHTNWQWTGWSDVQNGQTTADAPISVVARKKTQLDLFTIGFDGRVWTAAREFPVTSTTGQQANWGGWWPILEDKFVLGTVVSCVARSSNCLDIFVTGKDSKVRTAAWGPQTAYKWAGWWTVGQGLFLPGTPIAAVSRSENLLDLFAIGLDGRVWSAAWGAYTEGIWHGWFPILNHVFLVGHSVTAISRKTDQLDLFAVDGNGEVRTAAWSPTSNSANWGGWWRVTATNGKFTPGTPIAVASRGPNHLDVFGVGLDGRVWTAAWGPQTSYKWAGWWPIGEHKFAQGAMISAVARNLNQLDIFIQGLDGNTWSAAWDGNWKWFTV